MSDVNSNLETLFSKMESFVSSKTVVGQPIHVDDVIIVPLVDVSVGVGSGASNEKDEKNGKDSAIGGLGAKITPSAVLVIQNGVVQLVNVKNSSNFDKILNMVPSFLSDLNLGSVFGKSNEDNSEKTEKPKKTEI